MEKLIKSIEAGLNSIIKVLPIMKAFYLSHLFLFLFDNTINYSIYI